MSTPAMTTLWRNAATRTLSGAKHYLLAIVITWLVAGVAAGSIKTGAVIAQPMLLLLCLTYYTGAAARTRGLWEESVFWAGISRSSVMLGPMGIAFVLGVGAIACYFVGDRLGGETVANRGLAVAGLIALAIVTRIWPVFSVPFFYEGEYRRGMWIGPGLFRAWRVTGLPGARRLTLAFMIPSLVLLAPLAAVEIHWGPSVLVHLLFYAVALPYLSMLNLDLTAYLLAGFEERREAAA